MKPYGTENSKKEEVKEMFDRIAPAYDRLNHLLSFNMDKLWRRKTARMASKNNPQKIIDIATGTGDLAIALSRRMPMAKITGVDLSDEMVRVGNEKIKRKGIEDKITLITGDAENINFPENSFDCATAGFGVRNFQNIEAGIEEMARVLRQGGEIYVMEFSTPKGWLFGRIYRFYFHRILPRIGGLISRDAKAYTYLPASVDEFPPKERFIKIMEESGFASCEAKRLMWGIAYIYKGVKV